MGEPWEALGRIWEGLGSLWDWLLEKQRIRHRAFRHVCVFEALGSSSILYLLLDLHL